ncbi:MAG TPA: glycine cleavage system protein GcvH [Polyangiaceae bacterium]|jgi:glycine cleavage system H protein|nr:glycine cleavage system protein GcvH [Polyangiaceae bacterium]
MAQNVKADLKYTKDHEWAKVDDKEILVGITAYAVDQLGDITLVNLDVKEGDSVEAGKAFGTIESVKTLSDLFSPVTGKVTRINKALESKPELVNEDCYAAWMVAIEPAAGAGLGDVLDASAYEALLASLDH